MVGFSLTQAIGRFLEGSLKTFFLYDGCHVSHYYTFVFSHKISQVSKNQPSLTIFRRGQVVTQFLADSRVVQSTVFQHNLKQEQDEILRFSCLTWLSLL